MENKRLKNSQTQCKKHPKHLQPPGVCSMCLRDRLSKLITTSSRAKTTNMASSSSSCSSLSSLSSCCSPCEPSPVHHLAPRAKGSFWLAGGVRRLMGLWERSWSMQESIDGDFSSLSLSSFVQTNIAVRVLLENEWMNGWFQAYSKIWKEITILTNILWGVIYVFGFLLLFYVLPFNICDWFHI